MERWKDIPGYEGLYKASSLGRIYGCKRKSIVVANVGTSGYCQIGLCKEGKVYVTKVHILIALTFLGKPPIGKIVRHLDDNGGNNRLCNLAYGSHYDNIMDRHRLGRIGKPPASMRQKVTALNLIREGRLQKDVAVLLGISAQAVCNICKKARRLGTL